MSSNNENHEKEIDEVTGVETTGHEWDGLKELNNPLPRWWLILFYITIIWSVVYWVLMPAWPGLTDNTRGIRNHSERENVENALAALNAQRAENANRLLTANSLQEIERDPELLEFAMRAGLAAFGDNCATCHGTGGSGFVGYPNLNDDVWIWGGTLDDIKQTINYGIRSTHPQTRNSLMPAYGADGLLSAAQIDDLVEYVQNLSGNEADMEAVARAAPIYQQQCVTCHAADGTGDQAQGALNLTDAESLYGNDRASVRDSIFYARNSMMPHWDERLDEATVTSLAVYVHTLGGGE